MPVDIGCGPGNSTIALGKTGAKVTGIDFSQKMIDVATSTYPGLDFKLADTENIQRMIALLTLLLPIM